MTRKHFEYLAASLRSSKPERGNFPTDDRFHAAIVQWNLTVETLTFDLAQMYDRFLPVTFRQACGYMD